MWGPVPRGECEPTADRAFFADRPAFFTLILFAKQTRHDQCGNEQRTLVHRGPAVLDVAGLVVSALGLEPTQQSATRLPLGRIQINGGKVQIEPRLY
jgi:hypothetical protein